MCKVLKTVLTVWSFQSNSVSYCGVGSESYLQLKYKLFFKMWNFKCLINKLDTSDVYPNSDRSRVLQYISLCRLHNFMLTFLKMHFDTTWGFVYTRRLIFIFHFWRIFYIRSRVLYNCIKIFTVQNILSKFYNNLKARCFSRLSWYLNMRVVSYKI